MIIHCKRNINHYQEIILEKEVFEKFNNDSKSTLIKGLNESVNINEFQTGLSCNIVCTNQNTYLGLKIKWVIMDLLNYILKIS